MDWAIVILIYESLLLLLFKYKLQSHKVGGRKKQLSA